MDILRRKHGETLESHTFRFSPHLTRTLLLQRWRCIKLARILEKERHFLSGDYISHISVPSNCAVCVRCGQVSYMTALHNCIKMVHIYTTLCKDIEAVKAKRPATLIAVKFSWHACKLSSLLSAVLWC